MSATEPPPWFAKKWWTNSTRVGLVRDDFMESNGEVIGKEFNCGAKTEQFWLIVHPPKTLGGFTHQPVAGNDFVKQMMKFETAQVLVQARIREVLEGKL